MARFLFFTLLLVFLVLKSVLAYKAAVIEHYADADPSTDATIRKNIEYYREYIEKAKAQSVDIVVFPEYGLTALVSDPTGYAIDLNDNSTNYIQELRNIANETQIYLVVNLLEKEQQPNKKTKYFNTNLVFDKNGVIILKYRKINLFNEPNLTPGEPNQNVTFTTDFGVTFGIFTGFDILSENPSQRVLEDSRVTDIVHPTAWVSVMPFYTSLSVQYGYVKANGVNLLAANYNRPKESYGGSGIYKADGKIPESFITETSSTKPLIQEVSRINKRQNTSLCVSFSPFGFPGQINRTSIKDFVTKADFLKGNSYNTKKLDLSKSPQTEEICYDNFCCTFEIIVANYNSSEFYRIVAYDNTVDYYDYQGRVRTCGLVLCENDSEKSCGARINATTAFTKIKVVGNFTDADVSYRPVSLDYNLQPVVASTYCYQNHTNSSYVKFETLSRQTNILSFGLIGRTSSSTNLHAFGAIFLVVYSISKYFVF